MPPETPPRPRVPVGELRDGLQREYELIRDEDGEQLFLNWIGGAAIPACVDLYITEPELEPVATFEPPELKQAIRAFEALADTDAKREQIRDMSPFEEVWLERSDGYITLYVSKYSSGTDLLVLEAEEAESVKHGLERAVNEMSDVEDDPYV